MSVKFVSPLAKVQKLSAFRDLLGRRCQHAVDNLTFFQQSHNATVFKGTLDGQPVFFKSYELANRASMAQGCIDEIDAVSRRMESGVAMLVWASVPDGIIAIKEVPGVAVCDLLGALNRDQIMGDVGQWLRGYVGDTAFEDRFSTSYWVKKRAAVNIDILPKRDRAIATDLRDLQVARSATFGTMRAWKGQVPRDFAPQNLHWTPDGVWGFDMEGHRIMSLAQALSWFSVLVIEQSEQPEKQGKSFQISDATVICGQLQSGFSDCPDAPELMAFVLADRLFERFVKWADHGVKRPRLAWAINAHLKAG